MSLDRHATHPSELAYVVKLHRDALAHPEAAALSGRIEHLVSGDHADFQGGDALLAWLSRHLTRQTPIPQKE